MTTLRSEDWSNAHLEANDFLSKLLNQLRDHGYNPSQHISYNRERQHVTLDAQILDSHPDISQTYQQYLEACDKRGMALERIQAEPKLDIGFS